MNYQDHMEICKRTYVAKPGLVTVLLSVATLVFSAWGIFSAFALHGERITAVEKDVSVIQEQVDGIKTMSSKLDTLIDLTRKTK